jgi:6-phosphogluconolactonase
MSARLFRLSCVALLCNRLVIQRQRGEPRVTKIEYIDGADDAAIAAWVAERLKAALRRSSGPVAISVPGGATPFPICAELVRHPIDWSRITIWPGDDRIVPEDHPASNVGRIRALFTLTGARVVALEEGGIPPRFALTWLGMGTDGHIASLFPNTNPRLDDPCQIRRVTPDPLPLEAPVRAADAYPSRTTEQRSTDVRDPRRRQAPPVRSGRARGKRSAGCAVTVRGISTRHLLPLTPGSFILRRTD